MNHTFIKDKNGLLAYLESIKDKKYYVIALDIEAELNRHAFGERLCLVQIYDGEMLLVIDPLNIDVELLRPLFESRSILKVMYDASSDMSLLKNAYDIDIKTILDLRPAVDVLEYPKQDLHSVIAQELGVQLMHKDKYQKHNWLRRPIDALALEYALNDVIHLFKLKDAIYKRLYTAGLLDQYLLKNLNVQNKDYTRDPENRYRKVSGYSRLSHAEKEILKKIFDIRQKYARQCDMPPHNILSKTDLMCIVKDRQHIRQVKFPRRLSMGFINSLLQELEDIVSPKS
jgi:ribonuclease D